MDFTEIFQGGDMRSPIGSDIAAKHILENPNSIFDIVPLLNCGDKRLQMRAADCLEKASAKNPQILLPVRGTIIETLKTATQQEVRWHMAQIAKHLDPSMDEIAQMAPFLFEYLNDKSKIVITFALDTLVHFAKYDANIKAKILPILNDFAQNSKGATKARASRLLKQM